MSPGYGQLQNFISAVSLSGDRKSVDVIVQQVAAMSPVCTQSAQDGKSVHVHHSSRNRDGRGFKHRHQWSSIAETRKNKMTDAQKINKQIRGSSP